MNNEEDFLTNLCDPPTERAINALLCQYGKEVFDEVDDLLSPSTFTINSNQIVYKCVKDILESEENPKIDTSLLISTATKLGYSEFFQHKTEQQLLDQLFLKPVEKQNARILAGKVKKLEIARLLHSKLTLAREDVANYTGQGPLDELISRVEGTVLDFAVGMNGNDDVTVKLGDLVDDYVAHLLENPSDIIGVSSGYPRYDEAIGGGFRRGTVNLIGAPKKTGKSVISVNIGLHVAGKLGIPVLYLDTEMGTRDHLARVLSRLTQIPINDIEKTKFAQNKMSLKKVQSAQKYFRSIPFHYHKIAGKSFDEIFSIMRRFITKTVGKNEQGETNDCLIIYDYIKLMSADAITKNIQEYQALGFLASNLHDFMVKYDAPCLALSQLNKEGDIAQADRITWLCTSIAYFTPKIDGDIEEGGDQYGNRKFIVKYARHGGGTNQDDYINFIFNKACATIKEGKKLSEIKASEKHGDHSEDDDVENEQPPWEGEPTL